MATVIPAPASVALCELYGITDIPARYLDRIATALARAEECDPIRPAATFTPCSPRHTKCNPEHAEMMRAYWDAKAAQDARCEAATCGYAPEVRDYWRDVEPRITLPSFLRAWRRVEVDGAAEQLAVAA